MGENLERQPQNVGFDDFYGFLSVSDMYTEWRDPYFFPRSCTPRSAPKWVENLPFNKCFVHATRGGETEKVEEVTIPVLSLLDEKWARTPRRSSTDGGRPRPRGSSTTAPAARTSTTTPTSASSGRRPREHPYKDTIIELDDIVGRWWRSSRRPGRWRTPSSSSPPTTARRWRPGPTPPTRPSGAPRDPRGRGACGSRRSWRGRR